MDEKPALHNLEGLLRTIRQEGVERAQQEAERIVAEARERAATLLREAEQDVARREREAEERGRRRTEADREALTRAARDTLLAVRAQLARTLEGLLLRACRRELTGEFLRELIRLAVAGHAGGRPLAVDIGERDQGDLLDGLLRQLRDEGRAGLEVRLQPGIEAGFRIGVAGESLRIDVTNAALAEALASLVTPRLAALFDAALAGEAGR